DTVFNNTVNEFVIQQNAKLDYNKLQNEDGNNIFRIGTDQAYQEKDSHFKSNTITLNGNLVRNDLNIESTDEGTSSELYGLFLLKDKDHVDNHTQMFHLKPNCYSEELYKGIVNDTAKGVFNGKVYVNRDAQNIDA
ncbi:MAG: SufD family Fe-S cluster assembly protein, partial [Flavobacteriales bacterium]